MATPLRVQTPTGSILYTESQARIYEQLSNVLPGPTSAHLIHALDEQGWSYHVLDWTDEQCAWVENWLREAVIQWPGRALGRTERLKQLLAEAIQQMEALTWPDPPEQTDEYRARGQRRGLKLVTDAFAPLLEQDLPACVLQEALIYIGEELQKRHAEYWAMRGAALNLVRQLEQAI